LARSLSHTKLFALIQANQVLLWICLITVVNQLGFGMVIPVLPLFVQQFGGTAGAVGATVALYGLGRLLFDLPMGQLTEAMGRRKVLLIGEVITAVGALGCGLALNFPQLLAFRFVGGIGGATVLTVGQIMVADISQRHNRGRMMGVYMSFFQLAVGIGPVVGGLVSAALGARAPFLAFGILAASAGALGLVALPETHGLANRAAGLTKRVAASEVWRQLARSPGFILVGLIGFAATVVRTGGIFVVVPTTAYQHAHLSPAQVGLAITVANLLNLVSSSGAGALADRFGRKATIGPGVLLTCGGLALFAVQASYPLFVASALLYGLGSSLYSSPASAYAADLAPPGGNGPTMGAYRTLSDLGYVIGPLAVGYLADRVGAPSTLFIVAALLLVIVGPFLRFAPETRRATQVIPPASLADAASEPSSAPR
jgi:DHA1 family multidrug resistance protein-like MFS transporter